MYLFSLNVHIQCHIIPCLRHSHSHLNGSKWLSDKPKDRLDFSHRDNHHAIWHYGAISASKANCFSSKKTRLSVLARHRAQASQIFLPYSGNADMLVTHAILLFLTKEGGFTETSTAPTTKPEKYMYLLTFLVEFSDIDS